MTQPIKDDTDGFTLLELMVVVFILGVLMAIAIPTFLSAGSSSRAKGAESNLTIALTDESVYYTQNGTYGTSNGSPPLSTLDPGLNWFTCPASGACITDTGNRKAVYVQLVTDGSYSAVMLGSAGPGGSDYWALLSPNPASPGTEYLINTSTTPLAVTTFQASARTSW